MAHIGEAVVRIGVARTIMAAAVGSMLVAATPASSAPEIEDGCGDVDSHVMGQEVAHPTPPATDVDTVDLRGRYSDDDVRSLIGMEVEIVVCGAALDLATGEAISVGWYAPAERLDGCDRSQVGVTISRSVEDGSWSGSLARSCIVDSDCSPPLGLGGACGSSSSSELASVDLPPDALAIEDRTFTVILDRAAMPDQAADFLVDGDVLTGPWVYGSSFAGARVSTGVEDGNGAGAWVSMVEHGGGTDHVLGSDRS